MSVVNSYNLYLDSSQRLSGTSASPTFNTSPAIRLTSTKNYFQVRVNTTSIPFSFPQLSAANALVYAYWNGQLLTLPLRPGNYTVTSLTTSIVAALTTAVAALGTTIVVTWTYNKDTNLTTFTYVSSSATVTGDNIQLIYDSSPVPLNMLGFTSSKTISLAAAVTGDRPVNLQPVTSLYIRSDSLRQSVHSKEFIIQRDDPSDILAQVPIFGQPNTFITFNNASGQTARITNHTIDVLSFYITDPTDYRPIDLRGLDWNLCITVEELEGAVSAPDPVLNNIADTAATRERDAKLQALEESKQKHLQELEAAKNKILSKIK